METWASTRKPDPWGERLTSFLQDVDCHAKLRGCLIYGMGTEICSKWGAYVHDLVGQSTRVTQNKKIQHVLEEYLQFGTFPPESGNHKDAEAAAAILYQHCSIKGQIACAVQLLQFYEFPETNVSNLSKLLPLELSMLLAVNPTWFVELITTTSRKRKRVNMRIPIFVVLGNEIV